MEALGEGISHWGKGQGLEHVTSRGWQDSPFQPWLSSLSAITGAKEIGDWLQVVCWGQGRVPLLMAGSPQPAGSQQCLRSPSQRSAGRSCGSRRAGEGSQSRCEPVGDRGNPLHRSLGSARLQLVAAGTFLAGTERQRLLTQSTGSYCSPVLCSPAQVGFISHVLTLQ